MPDQSDLQEKLLVWMQGNEAAADVCVKIINVLNVWDDLIDQDKVLNSEHINEAFRTALVDLPLNPFYQANQGIFVPLILNSYAQWVCANKMERQPEDSNDLIYSYVLRDTFVGILVNCAFIVGGPLWLGEVGPDIWRYCGRESFLDYVSDLNGRDEILSDIGGQKDEP